MSSLSKYSSSARVLHWVSALLVIGLFALGLWMRSLDYYHPWYQPAPEWHKGIGLIFVAIIIVRLIVRFVNPPPKPLSSHQKWEVKLAHFIHGFLYLGLAIIFISGYLISTSEGRGISVFDLFVLPAAFPPFENQEDIAGFIHEWAAYFLIGAAVLHMIGALKHHFMDKDSTLKRML